MQALILQNRWDSRSAEEIALNILSQDRDPNSRVHVKHVSMGEIGAVRSDEERFAIGTTSLYHCLGIIFYDRTSTVGGVAHARVYEKNDGRWKLNIDSLRISTEKLISLANSKGGSKYEAYIVNLPSVQRKDADNKALQDAIENTLREMQIPIHAYYHGNPPMEFKLDTKTGLITPFWD